MDKLGGILDYLHRAAAKNVTGPNHGRIPNVLSDLERFFHRGNRCSRRLRDTQSSEKIFKLAPVRGDVNHLGGRPKNG